MYKLIFTNILLIDLYPELWILANVAPIHKKGSKQLITNYRPISLDIIFYLVSNDLITKHQSGFRPGDSTVNQLIDLVNSSKEKQKQQQARNPP